MTAVTSTATCTWTSRADPDGCGWTSAGPMSNVDDDADRHTRTTGHATTVRTYPVAQAEPASGGAHDHPA